MPERIYLDHAATSPLRPEAKAALDEGFRIWANPSSPHAEGRKARAALEDARERIKAALGWEGELIFTSGASEAALLAFEQAEALGEAASTVEHDAIHQCVAGWGADPIPVTASGAVDFARLRETTAPPSATAGGVRENRVLAAIQHVNSETGNRQDVARSARQIHQQGALLVSDCAQSAGKFALPVEADMLIVSAHKFGGPIGIGALLVQDFAMLKPQGGQERGYRRGTENLPGALGMAAALEACAAPYLDPAVLEPLDQLAGEVRALGGTWFADRLADPTPYIRAIAMPHMSGSAQVMRFDMAGIAVSQGSACSSGSMKPSHVLAAMGVPEAEAARTIRVSPGWNTGRAEVERFCDVWVAMAREAADRAA